MLGLVTEDWTMPRLPQTEQVFAPINYAFCLVGDESVGMQLGRDAEPLLTFDND